MIAKSLVLLAAALGAQAEVALNSNPQVAEAVRVLEVSVGPIDAESPGQLLVRAVLENFSPRIITGLSYSLHFRLADGTETSVSSGEEYVWDFLFDPNSDLLFRPNCTKVIETTAFFLEHEAAPVKVSVEITGIALDDDTVMGGAAVLREFQKSRTEPMKDTSKMLEVLREIRDSRSPRERLTEVAAKSDTATRYVLGNVADAMAFTPDGLDAMISQLESEISYMQTHTLREAN